MNDELENQMKMLEGIDFDNLSTVETADTLLGNQPLDPTPQLNSNTIVSQSVQPTATTPNVVTKTTLDTSTVNPNTVVPQPIQLDMNAAPVFVNLGESTQMTKTNFLKLKENECTRATIINYNASGTHFHYEPGLGYFKCLSEYTPDNPNYPAIKGICCLQPDEKSKIGIVGKGKTKVFLPVIEYPVSHTDGKTLEPGKKPTLKVLALSGQEYQTLFEIKKEYGDDTSTFDLSISRKRSDRGGFLEYTITPGPSWRSKFLADIQVEASKITNETYNLASEEFAKTLSVERVQRFYAEKAKQDLMATQIANQQVPGVDSLFPQM